MKDFSIIVAMDQNRGIGKNNTLPWHLPEDMAYFKKITTQVSSPNTINALIMGRKTWESIPDKFRPLPHRLNVILTRDINFSTPNFDQVTVRHSLGSALDSLPDNCHKVFIIGGSQIYSQAIKHPACKMLYITQVQNTFDCDCFFPDISKKFKQVSKQTIRSNNLNISFTEYSHQND